MLLQGHPSSFWAHLADGLAADGHKVLHVNLCLADRIFWGLRPALDYRGSFGNWKGWLRELLVREGVTDILYYADRLPYHRVAKAAARCLGLSCWAIEHGYLRPDWLTMEPDGMGAHSRFPRLWEDIERLASTADLPDLKTRFTHPFATEAFYEVSYNLLLAFGRPFFPLYWSDKQYWPALEYLSWILELALGPFRQISAHSLQKRSAAGEFAYNLVAMQIQNDYQIRNSSPFKSLADFLDDVMASFALSAPRDRHLVIKLHPLDNGLERWFSRTRRLETRHGLEGRVHCIKGGDLRTFIAKSEGVVVVNSTVGIHALRQLVPTFCAGVAVYDLPGLTHQGPLGTFWNAPEKPDEAAFTTLQRALTHIQVKGSFFNVAGRKHAIGEIRERFQT